MTLRLALSLALAAGAALSACAPSGDLAAASTEATTTATAAAADRAPADVTLREPAFSVYDLGSTWRDQHGEPLQLGELAGPVRLVSLVYTSCHATCPLIVADLKRIEASLPPDRRDEVGFVLVSLDPERDTPGRLAAWAAESQLDPARWTLLNGSEGSVRELAALLGVRYQEQPDGEFAHTNVITVLDAAGAVRYQQTGLGAAAEQTSIAVSRLLP